MRPERSVGFPRGIHDKIMLAAGSVVGVISVFTALFFPWRMEQQALRSVTAKAATVREIAAHGLRAPMVFADSNAAHEVLAPTLQDPDVVILQVSDMAGRTMVELRDDSMPYFAGKRFHDAKAGIDDEAMLLVTEGPVTMNGSELGRIRIGFSLSTLHAEVRSARRVGALFGALILVLGLSVAYAVARRITGPLKELSRTVTRITGGDLSLRAAHHPDVEVSNLVVAFNQMVDTVVATQRELEAANAALESRVEERTRTLSTFIELVPQPIISVDKHWRVTQWNRAAERLFGWTKAELLGKPLPYAGGAAAESFASVRRELEAGRRAPSTEAVRMHRNGTAVPVLAASVPLTDDAGAIVGYVAALTDLTERKSLEDQLRQSQKMEAVGRLAGGIAHDFNNILTVITVTSAMLLDDVTDDAVKDDVRQISEAALRAAALTKQLLAFSRSQVLTLKDVSVAGVVDNMLPMLRRLMRENVRIETNAPSRYLVNADAGQLEQVIMNLVVNAADAMPTGGEIRIGVTDVTLDEGYVRDHIGVEPGDYVRLQVADTGVGMSPETMARIYEPFFTTKPLGKGTGLGLATTYAIVNRMKGRIDVRSTPGVGTVFDLYLPRIATTNSEQPQQHPVVGSAESGTETVLLVEDEDVVRIVLRRGLERLGYRVRDAASAERALEDLARDRQVDIVVSDIMMPGMNGRQFAKQLDTICPHTPVILMTGYADADVIGDGFLDDGRPLAMKPITAQALAREIRATLRFGTSDAGMDRSDALNNPPMLPIPTGAVR